MVNGVPPPSERLLAILNLVDLLAHQMHECEAVDTYARIKRLLDVARELVAAAPRGSEVGV